MRGCSIYSSRIETLHSDSGSLNSGDTRMNEQNDEGWKQMQAADLSHYFVLGPSWFHFLSARDRDWFQSP